ncbi:hypothetical protein Hanom_Chr16g01523171 [Helianthus anomalus]
MASKIALSKQLLKYMNPNVTVRKISAIATKKLFVKNIFKNTSIALSWYEVSKTLTCSEV